MNNIGIFFNPFYLYSVVLSVIIIIYNLKWSDLYPNISTMSYLFMITTIIISFVLGKILNQKLKIEFKSVNNPLNIFKTTIYILIGYFLEFIYCGKIPFLEIVIKKSNYWYKGFTGIPTFHMLIVTFNSFFAIYVFHRYLIEKKKNYLFLFLINLVPSILIYNRGMLVLIGLSCISVYVFTKFNGVLKIKAILILSIVIIPLLYIFGITGNIRSNVDYKIDNNSDSTYIMMVGDASTEFRQSFIPKPYFWTYLYATSSLANFEKTVQYNNYNHELSIESINNFINTSILPDYIAKRIDELLNLKNRESYQQISNALTVSIMYSNPYVHLGWLGVILMYFFFSLFIFMYRIFLDKESPFFITAISILNTVVIFNFFSNSFTFSGLSFQLIYPILFSLILDKRYTYKLKRRLNF